MNVRGGQAHKGTRTRTDFQLSLCQVITLPGATGAALGLSDQNHPLLMAWDPALLRKYSSTNHFKLLNQVRSDLKEQPIQRSSGQPSRRGATPRRRPAAPVPQASPAPAETSYDAFVAVPVLIEPFET